MHSQVRRSSTLNTAAKTNCCGWAGNRQKIDHKRISMSQKLVPETSLAGLSNERHGVPALLCICRYQLITVCTLLGTVIRKYVLISKTVAETSSILYVSLSTLTHSTGKWSVGWCSVGWQAGKKANWLHGGCKVPGS